MEGRKRKRGLLPDLEELKESKKKGKRAVKEFETLAEAFLITEQSKMNVAEILKQVPQHLLDSQVSDIHLEELVSKITSWEDFAPYLKLTEVEEEEICRDKKEYKWQKRAALRLWKKKNGRHATYHQLIIVFCLAQRNDLADAVRSLLLPQPVNSDGTSDTSNILETFRSYLVDCYTEEHHPSHVGWPFSRTAAYIDLPLYDVPITELGTQEKAPPLKLVSLDKLFLMGSHKAKKVILLEGVAGSGKTTLSWHACQKWAEGLLLQQFSLLIRVSLEDPAMCSASRLADLIPHPSEKFRKAVENVIAEQNGEGVCFLLEGFDEAPPQLQQFIYNFLSGKSTRMNLPRCSIVVTSRPVASGILYPLLTSRVVMGRLDRASIDDMLSAYLSYEEGDASPSFNENDLEELASMLEQNSLLANLCNLPINAAIVVHLFRCGRRKLPETRTGLFKALVLNLLFRHIQQRTEHKLQEFGDDSDFEDLPDKIIDTFRALSSLAFKGIKQNTRVFSPSNLKAEGLQFTFGHLSLMEAHSTSFGFSRSFMFLHYSVQEFLAAWHMTRLGSEEQVKAVSGILSINPLSPVLPFFAGFTGLSNTAAREVLLEVTKHPLDHLNVLSNKPCTPSEDRRRLALALLNCIHETQNQSMCQLVNSPCVREGVPQDCVISLSSLGLEPSDCLSIGYFIAQRGNCRFELVDCAIAEAGIEALQKNFRALDANPAAQVELFLSGNLLVSRSMKILRQSAIELSSVSLLNLNSSWLPHQVATNLALLIAGLCRRSSPISLHISNCSITSEHGHLLVLLIVCECLHVLDLSSNDIGGAMVLVATALAQNTSLFAVFLDDCNLQDEALVELGKVLHKHRTIKGVDISKNPVSSRAINLFLISQFQSRLCFLQIGRPLNEDENFMYHHLSQVRGASSLQTLVIDRSHEEMEEKYAAQNKTLMSLPPRVLSRFH